MHKYFIKDVKTASVQEVVNYAGKYMLSEVTLPHSHAVIKYKHKCCTSPHQQQTLLLLPYWSNVRRSPMISPVNTQSDGALHKEKVADQLATEGKCVSS